MAIHFKDNDEPAPKRKTPKPPEPSVYIPNMPQPGYQVPYPEAKTPVLAREKKARKPVTKDRISIYLDPDVLEHFRSTGPGWQTKIQDVLRTYVEGERK